MNIIYFSPHPNLYLNIASGPGTHMREIMSGFEAAGHRVTPVIMGGLDAPEGSSINPEKATRKQALKQLIPEILWQTAKDFKLLQFDTHAYHTLLEQAKANRPDFIYERGYYLMTAGARVAKKLSIPLILELNAPYCEERVAMEGPSLLGNRALQRESFQINTAQRIVVVSSALRDYFATTYANSRPKIIITPNAIRHDFHPPVQGEIQHLRAQLQLENALVVGFVGSIFPYHGVDRLIRAFQQVANEHHHARLLIVGDGQILPDLRALAVELGLENLVIFTGKVSPLAVYTHIALMDVCVVPDAGWYMSPIKAFEYGIMGKAIVAADTVPMRDVMAHEKHGLLVNSSESALREGLLRLSADGELRGELAANFQLKVAREHTWRAMAERILAEVEEITSKNTASTPNIHIFNEKNKSA
jgi:glycosyltransferase involved in cell wall biosynthesis